MTTSIIRVENTDIFDPYLIVAEYVPISPHDAELQLIIALFPAQEQRPVGQFVTIGLILGSVATVSDPDLFAMIVNFGVNKSIKCRFEANEAWGSYSLL